MTKRWGEQRPGSGPHRQRLFLDAETASLLAELMRCLKQPDLSEEEALKAPLQAAQTQRKEAQPEHKRSYLVRLTPRGKTLLAEMWSREMESLNSLEHNLSIEDLQAATNVLHRLREALEQHQIDQEVTSS